MQPGMTQRDGWVSGLRWLEADVLSALTHQEKRGQGDSSTGEVKISGVELSISRLVIRLTA